MSSRRINRSSLRYTKEDLPRAGRQSHRALWHPTGRGGNDEKFHPSPQTVEYGSALLFIGAICIAPPFALTQSPADGQTKGAAITRRPGRLRFRTLRTNWATWVG